MATQVPVHQIRTFTATINGDPMDGQLDSFTPPQLVQDTTEYQSGGMDVPIDLDMGMRPLRASLVVNGYQSAVFKVFGLANGQAAEIIVECNCRDLDGVDSKLTFTMRGNVTTNAMGRVMGRGQIAKTALEISCTYYKIEHSTDGVLAEIDVFGVIRNIDGANQIAGLQVA